MKKIITFFTVFIAITVNGQMVIEAPTLEAINAQMLSAQASSTADQYQTQLNTLQTAKTTLSTYEQIKEWNDRVAEVSNAIKDYKDIGEIVNLTRKTYQDAQKTIDFINENYIKTSSDVVNVSENTVKGISNALTNMSTIITVLNSFVSSSVKMNDFERKTLIDKYKREAVKEAYYISQARKKYEMIMALNSF